MRKFVCLLCGLLLVICCLWACAPAGGELPRRTETVENNRVIGAETSTSVPVSTKAPAASTKAPVSSAPAGTQRPDLPAQLQGSIQGEGQSVLNLRMDYTAAVQGDQVTVACQLYLECYSLKLGTARPGTLTVNGQSVSFRTQSVDQPENVRTSLLLHEHTFTVPVSQVSGQGIPVQASWRFNGTYNQVAVEELTLDGAIVFGA